HLRELESLILRTIKPAGNHQTGKFIKSENLKGRFSRQVRERQNAERDWVIGRSTSPIPKRKRHKIVENGAPPLAAYIEKSTKLRAMFRGRLIRARVRKNGMIRYSG